MHWLTWSLMTHKKGVKYTNPGHHFFSIVKLLGSPDYLTGLIVTKYRNDTDKTFDRLRAILIMLTPVAVCCNPKMLHLH